MARKRELAQGTCVLVARNLNATLNSNRETSAQEPSTLGPEILSPKPLGLKTRKTQKVSKPATRPSEVSPERITRQHTGSSLKCVGGGGLLEFRF